MGGEPLKAKQTFVDVDPSTGQPLAEVARCGPEEVDAAVVSARRAFEGGWKHTGPSERSGVLRRISDGIREEAESLADLESRDTGKPLTQARADVQVAARYFEFYAGVLEAQYGDTIPLGKDLMVFTLREPFGVTAHIIPWNYPIQVGSRTVAPALAAGNCCVLKPAEEAPLTPMRLAEIAIEAGLPAGAFNVVPGLGEEAGAALATHRGIDHLSFTGSVEVGRLVGKAAAESIIPATLELGGKSPNIVFRDADLDEAVPKIVGSLLQNAGQTCSAGSRLLVEEHVRAEVVDAVAEKFSRVTIGPGTEDPELGPLISDRQRQRVAAYVDKGRGEARLVSGGAAPDDERLQSGFFYLPTLFDEAASDSTIAQEEIFGPVLAVTGFNELADAASVANSTEYGLVAAIWTKDIDKAHWLAREIRAGQVFINTYGAGGGVELPFGGYKHSGHGREKGFEALMSFTQTKTVVLKHTTP